MRKSKSKNKRSRLNLDTVQKVVMGAILIAMVIVIGVVVAGLFIKPQTMVESKIGAMAADYYENYLYKNLEDSGIYADNREGLKEVLAEYSETGLSSVTLRQFLLYDNRKYGADTEFLTKYCNENKTYVKFFPEPPYEKNSYRAEFNYSCNFE